MAEPKKSYDQLGINSFKNAKFHKQKTLKMNQSQDISNIGTLLHNNRSKSSTKLKDLNKMRDKRRSQSPCKNTTTTISQKPKRSLSRENSMAIGPNLQRCMTSFQKINLDIEDIQSQLSAINEKHSNNNSCKPARHVRQRSFVEKLRWQSPLQQH